MNEATRQFYLSALGIDVWEARHPLPGAAPSVARELSGLAAPTDSPFPGEDSTVFEPATTQSLDQIKSVLDEQDEADQLQDDPDTASLPVEAHEEQTDSTISLNAAFWHGSRLSLAADLGANAGRDLQLRLGTAIMQAIGEPGATPEALHWPAFENRALPGNDDASFDRLVQGVVDSSASSAWLFLGPECIEVLSSRLRGRGREIRLSSELSLSRLVSDGDAKRELWEAIKQSGLRALAGNGDGE